MEVEFLIPNVLRSTQLETKISEIISNLESGNTVSIINAKDHTDACVLLAESVKQRVHTKIFQTNNLSYEPVIITTSVLGESKIHHYKLKFNIKLSFGPLDVCGDETQQLQQ